MIKIPVTQFVNQDFFSAVQKLGASDMFHGEIRTRIYQLAKAITEKRKEAIEFLKDADNRRDALIIKYAKLDENGKPVEVIDEEDGKPIPGRIEIKDRGKFQAEVDVIRKEVEGKMIEIDCLKLDRSKIKNVKMSAFEEGALEAILTDLSLVTGQEKQSSLLSM